MLRPGKVVRRQWEEPPSAIIAADDGHPPWYKDAGIRKMMFPIILIYLTQVCTGFDATLTANLQSFQEWKRGMLSNLTSQGRWIRFMLTTYRDG